MFLKIQNSALKLISCQNIHNLIISIIFNFFKNIVDGKPEISNIL